MGIPRVRKNIDDLADDELSTYLHALERLFAIAAKDPESIDGIRTSSNFTMATKLVRGGTAAVGSASNVECRPSLLGLVGAAKRQALSKAIRGPRFALVSSTKHAAHLSPGSPPEERSERPT